jgi:hypothetical protein
MTEGQGRSMSGYTPRGSENGGELWQQLSPRERDELVAMRVMHWSQARVQNAEHIPPFSTDLTTAWQIVDMYNASGLRFELEAYGDSNYSPAHVAVAFRDHQGIPIPPYASAATAAEAICIAGLVVAGLFAES